MITTPEQVGAATLQALDEAGVPIDAAYWNFANGKPRFTVHTPLLTEVGRSGAYRQILEALGSNDDVLPLREVYLVTDDDALYNALRQMVSTGGSGINGIRISESSFNGVYVEDVLAYRL